MNNIPDHPFIRRSHQLYACLLAAYPKRHREEYGPAMQQVFCDQCREAWREARGWGLAMLWLRVLPDLLKTSFVERLSTIQGDSMSHRFARILGSHSNPRVLFLRTAVAVFAVIFGATAITTFLVPKRFTSEAQLFVRYVVDNPRDVPRAGNTPSAEKLTRAARVMAGEMQWVQSDAVLERVVKSQNLETRWAKALGQRLTIEEAVALLRSRLEVRLPPRSNVLQLRVNSDDAKEASRIAWAIIDACLTESREDTERRMQLIRSTVGPDTLKSKPLHEFGEVTGIVIVQSPTPGDLFSRPDVPGCLLLGGAGGLFLALTVGVAATLLAKRRVPEKPESSPSSSAGAAA